MGKNERANDTRNDSEVVTSIFFFSGWDYIIDVTWRDQAQW
jgi:hypothetical protein